MPETIKDYLPKIKQSVIANGLSPKTWTNYLTGIYSFNAWIANLLDRPAEPTDLTTPLCRAFMEHLSAKGVIANTRRLRATALLKVAKWFAAREIIAGVPVIELPRMEAQHRIVPTTAERDALMDACERFRRPEECALTALVLRILIHTGVRRGELMAILLTDVSIERNTIHIRRGKGGKERHVPICEELREALCRYLAIRPRTVVTRLLVQHGASVGERTITTLFRELRARAGLHEEMHLNPHGMRHLFAHTTYTNMVEAGVPDPTRKLQKLLGHSSIQTTERYLQKLGIDIDECAAYTGTQRPIVRQSDRVRRVNWE